MLKILNHINRNIINFLIVHDVAIILVKIIFKNMDEF